MRAPDGGVSAHSTGSSPPVAAPAAAADMALWAPGHPLTVAVPLSAGEVQAFYEDLSGRQYVNEIFNFSVDKLYDLLFTDSPFQRDFMEQRRFSGASPAATLSSLPEHLLPRALRLPPRAAAWARPPGAGPRAHRGPAVQGTVSSRAAAATYRLGACCVPSTVHYRLILTPAPCASMGIRTKPSRTLGLRLF